MPSASPSWRAPPGQRLRMQLPQSCRAALQICPNSCSARSRSCPRTRRTGRHMLWSFQADPLCHPQSGSAPPPVSRHKWWRWCRS
eukprot:108613-Chlamydomonas_euryale.AAC.15